MLPSLGVHLVGCTLVSLIKRKAGSSLKRSKAWSLENITNGKWLIILKHVASLYSYHSFRVILSIAISHCWVLLQLEVSNPFLHGHLHKCVYGSTSLFCWWKQPIICLQTSQVSLWSQTDSSCMVQILIPKFFASSIGFCQLKNFPHFFSQNDSIFF